MDEKIFDSNTKYGCKYLTPGSNICCSEAAAHILLLESNIFHPLILLKIPLFFASALFKESDSLRLKMIDIYIQFEFNDFKINKQIFIVCNFDGFHWEFINLNDNPYNHNDMVCLHCDYNHINMVFRHCDHNYIDMVFLHSL